MRPMTMADIPVASALVREAERKENKMMEKKENEIGTRPVRLTIGFPSSFGGVTYAPNQAANPGSAPADLARGCVGRLGRLEDEEDGIGADFEKLPDLLKLCLPGRPVEVWVLVMEKGSIVAKRGRLPLLESLQIDQSGRLAVRVVLDEGGDQIGIIVPASQYESAFFFSESQAKRSAVEQNSRIRR